MKWVIGVVLAFMAGTLQAANNDTIYSHPALPYGTSVMVSGYPDIINVCWWMPKGKYVWDCVEVEPGGASNPTEVVIEDGILISPVQPFDNTPVRISGARWVYYYDDEGVLQPMQGWDE